jgi:hypothetical protein
MYPIGRYLLANAGWQSLLKVSSRTIEIGLCYGRVVGRTGAGAASTVGIGVDKGAE